MGYAMAAGLDAAVIGVDGLEHLRCSNPTESVFATVPHRIVRTIGALSQKTAKLMVFILIQAASRK